MKIIIALFATILGFSAAFGQIDTKDMLSIKITGVPVSEKARLDNEYQVSSSGTINMWVIGTVRAAGLTTTQLASTIASKYKAAGIYNSPTFIVTSQSETGDRGVKTFTVGGQVKSPGPKPWKIGMTLYNAIQAAGGETPFGAINRVKLFRNGNVYTYDLRVDKYKTLKIYEKDMIDVPETGWNGK
ncbi:polysaccharide biosynthesis/export family protein [Verrucomicrobiaceae bacterium 227]